MTFDARANSHRKRVSAVAWLVLLSMVLGAPLALFGDKKKKSDDAPAKIPVIDYSNIVWPNPPAVARIRYQAFYSAQKLSQVETPSTKKAKWMDRLAGTQPTTESGKVLFQTGRALRHGGGFEEQSVRRGSEGRGDFHLQHGNARTRN